MKRKTYGSTPVKVIKTSISLPEVLLRFAEERCAVEGFNSFSAYVAHLVRVDKERQEEKTNPSSSHYTSHAQDTAAPELNEGKPPKKKAS